MTASMRSIKPLAYLQYYLAGDVTIGGVAGIATIINPTTDFQSLPNSLLVKTADGFQPVYACVLRVTYSMECYASANDTGMAGYITKNGVIVPHSWSPMNARASDAESGQLGRPFLVDCAAGDILRMVHWKKETGTHVVNADASGGSLAGGLIYGTGILVEVVRML